MTGLQRDRSGVTPLRLGGCGVTPLRVRGSRAGYYHEAAARGRAVSAQSGDVGLPEHGAFGPMERRRVRHGTATTTDGLIAALGTHSWALAGTPADRDAAFDRVRAYLGGRPETASGAFTLPLLTTVLRALRR